MFRILKFCPQTSLHEERCLSFSAVALVYRLIIKLYQRWKTIYLIIHRQLIHGSQKATIIYNHLPKQNFVYSSSSMYAEGTLRLNSAKPYHIQIGIKQVLLSSRTRCLMGLSVVKVQVNLILRSDIESCFTQSFPEVRTESNSATDFCYAWLFHYLNWNAVEVLDLCISQFVLWC